MNDIETVKEFYNGSVESEWSRIGGRPEFMLTVRFIDRYAKPGCRVLDIGGGPGRYSLYLAGRGCDVTLFDLSDANVRFAAQKADEMKLPIGTVCGDARFADKLTDGLYDCVLLMGPLYHLLDEADRTAAVNAALRCLKPGGVLFASFINMYGGLVYMLKEAPEVFLSDDPMEIRFREKILRGESYAGDAFTKAFFIQPREIEPFMSRFPLEKLHLFGQEGVMSPNEAKIYSAGKEAVSAVLDFNEKICEFPELYSWSEHLMYVGRKV